jgi:hypothetical protein
MKRILFRAAGMTILCLFFSASGFACSPIPSIGKDENPTHSGALSSLYQYVAVVIGEQVLTMQETIEDPTYVVKALRVRVLETWHNDVGVGEEKTIYAAGVASDCRFIPRSLSIKEYPVGTKLHIYTDDLRYSEKVIWLDS